MTRNHRGFSLVEMMVVIGVFGLLTALSLPAFSRYVRSNRVSTSVSRFAGDLQMARSRSIANGRVIRVAKKMLGIPYRFGGSSALGRYRALTWPSLICATRSASMLNSRCLTLLSSCMKRLLNSVASSRSVMAFF